ncbi:MULTISPECIES: 16S rRNA (guanine(966)-N(2))-methyltransferase RsmD [Microbulbifer]|uniref:16S rRNA (guanine(966)-N(2))-methyltransferase RsmD n=1 Tax=Microbulbifer TaxID=48073 RepID=UPI001CD437BB|nr:16S rRNA (guanine(966)-N(2))-methyltransferase RsmD [Microbulbifer agarilyticus]MCA0900020.1 16S rRNA (guanine(966)-N(2))-methyltransferase RsmD [Microbulbifer agarilyticus]
MPRNRRPRPSKPSSATQAPSQLRIIGGRWRGRKVAFAPIEGLRPTGDRLRETLFNWLQFHLPDARCLDLFAGSGALGLEALSRGAAHVDFVELDGGAARTLREQLKLLQAAGGEVHNCTAEVFTSQSGPAYDVVFVDPPFARNLWADTLNALAQSQRLSTGTLVYVESPRDNVIAAPEGWQLEKEKHAGQVCMRLYRV